METAQELKALIALEEKRVVAYRETEQALMRTSQTGKQAYQQLIVSSQKLSFSYQETKQALLQTSQTGKQAYQQLIASSQKLSVSYQETKQIFLEVSQTQQQSSNKMITSGNGLAQNILKIGQSSLKWLKGAAVTGVTALANGLVSLGKQGIDVADDLEMANKKIDRTFGKAQASKIEEFSKTALESFGLTEIEAKQFQSSIGEMLKGAGFTGNELVDMSQQLTGLSGDMAAFHNMNAEEAFEAIQAGIAGDTESLKQLGIDMSSANLQAFALAQGIGKSYSAMTEGEQTLLRYQYLMEQTGDVQGEVSRSGDSFAVQQKLLKANISQLSTEAAKGLLPILTQVAKAMNDFFASEAGERLREIIVRLMGVLANFMPILSPIGQFLEWLIPKVADGLEVILGWIEWIGEKIGFLIEGAKLLADVASDENKYESPYGDPSTWDDPTYIPDIPTIGFANGGFANRPSIFGEAGLEAAIPIRPGNPRSIGLLERTAQLLGVSGKPSVQLNYSPTLYGQTGNLEELLRQQSQEMRDFLEDYFMDQRRLAW